MTRTGLRLVFLLSLCCLQVNAQEPVEVLHSAYSIDRCRYWYDNSTDAKYATFTSGQIAIDVSELEEGFHTMHYQVISSKGNLSPTRTASFFRIQPQDEAFKDYAIRNVRYWFDKDYTPHETPYVNGTSTFDLSKLEEGFHTLHYQVIDSKGEASPARTAPFFRLPPKEEAFKDYEVKDIQYWFDEDIATIRTGTFMPGAIGLDLSSLSEGAHNMYYQLVADNHQVSPVKVASINRYLYDIYVSQPTEYDDSYIAKDPLFAEKPELKLHYSADDISIRGQLTIKEDATISLGKLVQTGCLGYYNNSNKYTKTGIDYYHPTTLISNGFMRADSVIVKENFYRDRWHFITLPFNTKVGDIDVPEGTYWAIRKYDGAARAAGEMINTWKNLQEADIMEAGQGYILQLTKEGTDKSSCLTFEAINDTHKNDLFATQDVSIALQDHQSEFAHNRSWNLIGNPYPCFYDTRLMNLNGTITVWNGNGYSAYSLADDMYILMPFESFFIQKPVDAETLTFSKEGRQHTAVECILVQPP